MLRVENLTKEYSGIVAVNDLSFDVRQGEVFGLLGPNGAGKTTTIRMIITMIKPDSGRISFNNDFTIDADRIGYLPEERGLYRRSKVRETLGYFAALKNVAKKTAQERMDYWLERFEMKDYAQRRCEELSKGQQQKLQLMAALIHEPELIILDEPFSGLDPVNQNVFKDIIVELSRQGKTVILSAHQMDHVEKMCERICMIHKGRRVLYGALEEIKNQYDDHRVRIICSADERKKLTEAHLLEGVEDLPNGLEGRLNPAKTFSRLLQEVGQCSDVQRIERIQPSLEQIFIRCVSG
jgi:ABC-2 type transport system ATP-binding protein